MILRTKPQLLNDWNILNQSFGELLTRETGRTSCQKLQYQREKRNEKTAEKK
jgi:hypothetical protein